MKMGNFVKQGVIVMLLTWILLYVSRVVSRINRNAMDHSYESVASVREELNEKRNGEEKRKERRSDTSIRSKCVPVILMSILINVTVTASGSRVGELKGIIMKCDGSETAPWKEIGWERNLNLESRDAHLSLGMNDLTFPPTCWGFFCWVFGTGFVNSFVRSNENLEDKETDNFWDLMVIRGLGCRVFVCH